MDIDTSFRWDLVLELLQRCYGVNSSNTISMATWRGCASGFGLDNCMALDLEDDEDALQLLLYLEACNVVTCQRVDEAVVSFTIKPGVVDGTRFDPQVFANPGETYLTQVAWPKGNLAQWAIQLAKVVRGYEVDPVRVAYLPMAYSGQCVDPIEFLERSLLTGSDPLVGLVVFGVRQKE